LQRALLGSTVLDPPSRRFDRNFLARGLSDAVGWRSILYLLTAFLVSIIGGCVSITVFFIGLGGMTHWYWSQFLPAQFGADGHWHRGARIGPDLFIDTPALQIAAVIFGAVVLALLWPAVVHGFALLQASLASGLLGPSAAERRLMEVASGRRNAIEGADRRFRQLERNLHDGPQAQLVTIAMKLGDAVDRIQHGEDLSNVASLLQSAHTLAQDTLVGVRGLSRGIHPPGLDDGLETAIGSLAAGMPLPVRVSVRLPDRPDAAIETIAYFCVSELVANVIKHARANSIAIDISQLDGVVSIVVDDDGMGGAELVPGGAPNESTGLNGLQERIAGVDGTLDILSPPGGPTTVRVALPQELNA
jgi:signal transduction histidine kinase